MSEVLIICPRCLKQEGNTSYILTKSIIVVICYHQNT